MQFEIHPNRRRAVQFLAAATTFPLPALGQEKAKLRVGIVNGSSDVAIFIAQEKGWFKDEGIDVETEAFRSGVDMVAPMGTGQLDAGGGSVSAGLYNAWDRGIKLSVVADKASSQPGYGLNKCLVARRHVESGRYKGISDLKGMKLAMAGPGNSAWGSLAAVLKTGGLGLRDVETVDLSYPDHVLAFKNKSVDGSITIEPSGTLAILNGDAIEVTSDDKAVPHHSVAQLLFSPKLAADADLGRRFMRAYLRSLRAYHSALKDGKLSGPQGEYVISVLTRYTAIKDPNVFRRSVPNGVDPNGRLDIATLEADQNVYREMGWLASNVRVDQVVDMSFVNAALADIGEYKAG